MTSNDPADPFAQAADALYALPPAAFTAERNARAKAARADGDRDLAARISALPRASASAWLVNVLVREAEDDLDQVLRLGAELREAQRGADRDRLRELGAARRDLLAEVADRAADRAQEEGHRAGAAALEELQQTLQAAMVDDDAAAAVRTGRLVRALQADGLDPVDVANAVGGPGGGAPARRKPQPDRAPDHDAEGKAERARQREAAAQHVADAERRARRASTEAEDAAADAADAEEQVRQQEQAAQDLRRRLDELRTALHEAEQLLTEAQQAASAARETADRTARDADDARHDVEAATARLGDLQDD